MKNFSLSLRQAVVITLVALAAYVQSPAIAAVAVLALFVKEGREFLENKQKVLELQAFERKLDAQAEELRRVEVQLHQMLSRHAQTFGE